MLFDYPNIGKTPVLPFAVICGRMRGSLPKSETFVRVDHHFTFPDRQDAGKEALHWLVVRGARHNNLKNINVPFPIGAFSVVTGVSGSGKSSLINDILWKSLAKTLHRANTQPGAHDSLSGIEYLNKVIRVDQQPIGATPTSNPATYTGVFDQIRDLFAQLPEAKVRGYSSRRFSFNVPGGRCEKCEGAGQLKIEMHFLPNVWITCDACEGKRYDAQTLSVQYRGHSIADVLEMTCGEAVELFQNVPSIRRILQTLCDVGLDYIALGQSAPTLSGGEAQRVKLAAELSRPDTGRTLYLLDEPTTGLHFDDLQNLLNVLHRLVDLGNTVVVIEHNLDVIKNADWIVDLGPEAGNEGGSLVFAGTPEELIERQKETANDRRQTTIDVSEKKPRSTKTNSGKKKQAAEDTSDISLSSAVCRTSSFLSYTAQALLPVFEASKYLMRKPSKQEKESETPRHSLDADFDEHAKMPWETNGLRWHTQDRVSRSGQPIRWEGKILAEIIQRIDASEKFAPVNWNHRSIVEVTPPQKQLGWFLHALTSEQWLLKLKIRVPRNTFNKTTLVSRLDLKPLNDVNEIPLYGTHPRVHVAVKGRWQEIELRPYSWKEIDRKEFWDFLETCITEFASNASGTVKPKDLMPWKVLGKAWHHLPRGFIGGKKLHWDVSLLDDIFGMLTDIAPDLRVVWTNKVLVPFHRPTARKRSFSAMLKGRNLPDVVVHTKRVDAVYVDVYVAKNSVPLGKIRNIGREPFVNGEDPLFDILQFRFTDKKELQSTEFRQLLHETLVSET